MYINHELLSASFRYAFKYENSFQIYCNASIWLEKERSEVFGHTRPNQSYLNPGRRLDAFKNLIRKQNLATLISTNDCENCVLRNS